MNKFFSLYCILPATLLAGSININSSYHNGSSSYTVKNKNIKSELKFPFSFNSIGMEYFTNFKNLKIGISYNTLLNYNSKKGEDFDWKDNNLTIYSNSKNNVKKFENIELLISKRLYLNFDIFATFNYTDLEFDWYDTNQVDYLLNKKSHTGGKTLKFRQEFYKYSLGIQYKNHINKKMLLILNPSLTYAYINTKDSHILRGFYTTQNFNTLGYDFSTILIYKINKRSNLKISYKYEKLSKDNTDMSYYNNSNYKFNMLPSSYKYNQNKFKISYSFLK